jgi:CheY-like chemotaxis protein
MDLNEVLAETGKLLRRLIGEHIELHTSLASDLPRVRAAPGLIQQVILNLAVNGRDAMPQGGRLRLETCRASLPSGVFARLTVTDTGCGIDPEVLPHIFEPFFTTKEVGKGTGLGLATVYGIVQSLQGEIRVHSVKGLGTTIEIDLPEAPGQDEPLAVTVESAPAAPSDALVLLVEDEDGVREVCRLALEMAGYRVVTANSAAQAIQCRQELQKPIDLLITDMVMPGMNGRDLARVVRQVQPRARVLYMSGYVADDLGDVDSLGEELHFLQKPFTPRVLVGKVREVLERNHTR